MTPTPKSWRERFNEEFSEWILQDNQECYRSFDLVKNFFQNELSTKAQEIRGVKSEAPEGHPAKFAFHEEWYKGFNQALESAAQILEQ